MPHICTKCQEEKPASAFYVRRDSPKGVSSHCRQCHTRKQVGRHKEVKLKLVEMFGGKCKECGFDSEPRILQFHHREASQKSFQISKRTLHEFSTLVEECKKCDLLCPNCHAVKHLS